MKSPNLEAIFVWEIELPDKEVITENGTSVIFNASVLGSYKIKTFSDNHLVGMKIIEIE